ncbi:MAG: sialidase family protein [Thermoanaerobaculales bacterium]|nr:sialidase family protein [Thermoanaerobaculales bacterium]
MDTLVLPATPASRVVTTRNHTREWAYSETVKRTTRLVAIAATLALLATAPAAAQSTIGPPVQVNVAADDGNIVGDAANEPTLAVDPTAPNRMVAAWRQFDDPDIDLRTAGWATSIDGGRTWAFHGDVEPGVWASDPVLAADGDGRLYHLVLDEGYTSCTLHVSDDAGASWSPGVPARGGDKPWLAADPAREHVYVVWDASFSCCGEANFARSIDGGATFENAVTIDSPISLGTMTVGPDGAVFVAGIIGIDTFAVARSTDARDPAAEPTFTVAAIDLGGSFGFIDDPNPGGLSGMPWVAVSPSGGVRPAPVYLLASVDPPGADPLDVHLARSVDGGATWTEPILVNAGSTVGWQWFGALDVAPDGRLDAVWYDSPDESDPGRTRVLYAASADQGDSWSEPVVVAPEFDSHTGWPAERDRLGDYIHLRSDTLGATLVFAATYNHEQDIYSVRIGPRDCNRNHVPDVDDIAAGEPDCDRDGIPDACEIAAGAELDCNGDGIPDRCQIAPRRPGGRRTPGLARGIAP